MAPVEVRSIGLICSMYFVFLPQKKNIWKSNISSTLKFTHFFQYLNMCCHHWSTSILVWVVWVKIWQKLKHPKIINENPQVSKEDTGRLGCITTRVWCRSLFASATLKTKECWAKVLGGIGFLCETSFSHWPGNVDRKGKPPFFILKSGYFHYCSLDNWVIIGGDNLQVDVDCRFPTFRTPGPEDHGISRGYQRTIFRSQNGSC